MAAGSGDRKTSIRTAEPGCLPVTRLTPRAGVRATVKAARGRANSRPHICAMLFAASFAAACAQPAAPPQPGAVAPELFELANIRPSNVVPKSSPSTLVKTFESFCLDGSHDPARVAARLRSASFVEVPKELPGWPSLAQQTNVTAFVVDDTRPMVMISADGRTCAVAAESRTGQTARIQEMISERFPSAQPLESQTLSPGMEIAVSVTGAAAGVIFVKRLAPSISNSRLILGIVRDQ